VKSHRLRKERTPFALSAVARASLTVEKGALGKLRGRDVLEVPSTNAIEIFWWSRTGWRAGESYFRYLPAIA